MLFGHRINSKFNLLVLARGHMWTVFLFFFHSDKWWRHQAVSTKQHPIKLCKIRAEGSVLCSAADRNHSLKWGLSLAIALSSRGSSEGQIQIMTQLLNHNFKPNIPK